MDENTIDDSDGLWARHVSIEQAKGALTALFGVDSDEAFSLLVEQSQDRNIKLHLLADVLLDYLRESPPTLESPRSATALAREKLNAFCAAHHHALTPLRQRT